MSRSNQIQRKQSESCRSVFPSPTPTYSRHGRHAVYFLPSSHNLPRPLANTLSTSYTKDWANSSHLRVLNNSGLQQPQQEPLREAADGSSCSWVSWRPPAAHSLGQQGLWLATAAGRMRTQLLPTPVPAFWNAEPLKQAKRRQAHRCGHTRWPVTQSNHTGSVTMAAIFRASPLKAMLKGTSEVSLVPAELHAGHLGMG